MADFFLSQSMRSAPVAGLDNQAATKIIFTLQQCALGQPQDEDIAQLWLQTLQLGTVFHERLLADLDMVEDNLEFWNRRLQEGSHVSFMLLQRGPVHFARRLSRASQQLLAWLRHTTAPGSEAGSRMDSVTEGAAGIHTPRLRGGAPVGGTSADGSAPPFSHSGAGTAGGGGSAASATNKMQRRVLLLEALRNVLAETLAQVSGSVRLLWLNQSVLQGAPTAVDTLAQARNGQGLTAPGAGSSSSQAMLQAAKQACQDVATELLQLSANLQERLRQLQLKESSKSSLPEVAVARLMTGCATLTNSQTATVAPALQPTLARMASISLRPSRSISVSIPPAPATQQLPGQENFSVAAPTTEGRPSMEVRESKPRQVHTNPLASQDAPRPVPPAPSSLSPLNIAENSASRSPPHSPPSSSAQHPQGIGRGSPVTALQTRGSGGSTGGNNGTPRHNMRLSVATSAPPGNGVYRGLVAGTAAPAQPPQQDVQQLLQELQSALKVDLLPARQPPAAAPAAQLANTATGRQQVDAAAGPVTGVAAGAQGPQSPTRTAAAAVAGAAGGGDSPLARRARELWRAAEDSCEELEGSAAAVAAVLTPAMGTGTGIMGIGIPEEDTSSGWLIGWAQPRTHRHRRRTIKAADALELASQAAQRAGPLVAIPDWARMPSWFQRRWLFCVAGGVLGLWAARWVWKHSPAGGSDDLTRWTKGAWNAAQNSVKVHIVQPLQAVQKELTHTFRDRPSIVSQQEFDADKQSLLRMLTDFDKDVKRRPPAVVAAPNVTQGVPSDTAAITTSTVPGLSEEEQAALLKGMHLVMATYESELKDPVRNLLMGQLARSLLIQVQRLKLDTEAAMLEMDQILRANELSISLVAAIPALAISWGTLATLARWLLPRAPDPHREAIPCRMALTSLERALHHLADQEETLQQGAATAVQPPGLQNRYSGGTPSAAGAAAALTPTAAAAAARVAGASGAAGIGTEVWLAAAAPGGVTGWLDAEGMVLYRIDQLYREATSLFLTADTTSRYSEWPNLSNDLSELTGAAGAVARLRVLDRMARNYQVFKR